ncbi:hypothetical protein ACLKMY_40795 [Paraburkholderia mimosarum]|uniref:hypothetical protein n=1 Tax=Paraburkholderia mimosarum TaxID=312026 RepID=UPI0012DFFEB2
MARRIEAAKLAAVFGDVGSSTVDGIRRRQWLAGRSVRYVHDLKYPGSGGDERGPEGRHSDPLEARLNEAMRRVGELTMENEILHKERERQARTPLVARKSSK